MLNPSRRSARIQHDRRQGEYKHQPALAISSHCCKSLSQRPGGRIQRVETSKPMKAPALWISRGPVEECCPSPVRSTPIPELFAKQLDRFPSIVFNSRCGKGMHAHWNGQIQSSEWIELDFGTSLAVTDATLQLEVTPLRHAAVLIMNLCTKTDPI
jgi:hypothetical protein